MLSISQAKQKGVCALVSDTEKFNAMVLLCPTYEIMAANYNAIFVCSVMKI
jgi:hypothetical protein